MTQGTDQLRRAFRPYTVDGIPASGEHEPEKAEIRAAVERLGVELGAAQAGLTTVADIAARDAFFANAENQGKLVYVNDNNGDPEDPANGVYEYVEGSARLAAGFYQGVATVVQPLVDEAAAWAEGTAPGGPGTFSAREWADLAMGNATLFAAPGGVVVNTAARTVTITGRIVMGRRNRALSGAVLDYSSVSDGLSRYLLCDMATGDLSFTDPNGLASIGSGIAVFAILAPNTGELSGIPAGYTRDGRILDSPFTGLYGRVGSFFGAYTGVQMNTVAKTITLNGRVVAGDRVSVNISTVVNFSAVGSSPSVRWLVLNIDTGAVSFMESVGLDSLGPTSVVFAQFVPLTGEMRGIPGGYTLDGYSAHMDGLNRGLALSIPERLNFNFNAQKIEITGQIQVLHQGWRRLIEAQEVDFSSQPRTLWGIVLLNPATGIVSVVNGATNYGPNLIVLGAFRQDLQCVAGFENYSINGVPQGSSASSASGPSDLAIGWDLSGVFRAPPMPGYTVNDPLPLLDITSADINGWYDDLVAAHPDYITRDHLGDTSTGLPIYEYRFKPDMARSGLNGLGPAMHLRVMLLALHSEQLNYVYPYHLMELVANHWEDDPILEAFRWGVEWSVVPALNPYAIDNHQRPNANDVDINRNFPVGWVFDDTTPQYKSGPFPLSELETQYAFNLMESFRPHLFVDCHCFGVRSSPDEDTFLWPASGSAPMRAVGGALINRMSRLWRDENSWVPGPHALGFVQGYPGTEFPGIAQRAAESLGAHGITFETAYRLHSEPGSIKGSPLTVQYAVEALGNIISLALRKIAG